MTDDEVLALIKLYQEGSGTDDVAGPQLQHGGSPVQAALIRLLDDPAISERDAGAILQILHAYFPSEESYAAMSRYVERIKDATARLKARHVLRQLRGTHSAE